MSLGYGDPYAIAPSDSMIGRAILYRKKEKNTRKSKFYDAKRSLLYLKNLRELCSTSLTFVIDKQERVRD